MRVKKLGLIVLAALLSATASSQVQVRHTEGLVHGFLTLRTLEGELLADGDLLQTAQNGRVTSRLVFHFKDGSLHDDTVVFTERGAFRFVSEHLIQKGSAFPHPLEMTINGASGQVTVHYTEDGKEKDATEHMQLSPDLASGMVLTLLKNIKPDAAETRVSFVAPTPKPQMVKLLIKPVGEEPFTTGEAHRKAMHFNVHIDIGGLKGAVAGLLGKQPPDTNVWILEGEAPAFVKSEGPLAIGAPVWRIELVSPVWPKENEAAPEKEKKQR